MAGTVLVSKTAAWSCSSSAYLWVLEPVCASIPTRVLGLSGRLKIGLETRILDLQDLPAAELRLLFDLLKKAYADSLRKGGGHFESEAIYQEYLKGFRALIGIAPKIIRDRHEHA